MSSIPVTEMENRDREPGYYRSTNEGVDVYSSVPLVTHSDNEILKIGYIILFFFVLYLSSDLLLLLTDGFWSSLTGLPFYTLQSIILCIRWICFWIYSYR